MLLAIALINYGKVKEPILLVHGLTYSSHEFDVNYKDYSLVRFLAKKGFEVWTFDVTGYGSSQPVTDGFMPNSDYAADDIAAVVKAVLARHNLDNMSVMGWSWGTVTNGRFCTFAEHECIQFLLLTFTILTFILCL